MPNTCPVVDSPDLVRELTRDHPIELRVMAAVTKGSCSKELNDLGPVVDAGAVGLSDDGQPVSDARFMRRALEFSALRGVPVASHCEDKSVGVQGSVRSGNVAEILDVSGWDPAREWAMVERDIALAEETGGHVHICHVSTARSVEAIRSAKSKGLNISAEVTPHHLTLTADAVLDIGANAKMNPPLGDPEDRDALVEALATGAIDCIATDHAPHTRKEKSQGLLRSPFGVIGLETSFAVCYTELVRSDRITLERLIDAMAIQPRRIFKLEGVALAEGSRADMVLVDLDREWTVDPEMFQSKGRNCPFAGRRVAGKVLWTMYRGILWKVDV
jgi:dihydroorotase